MRAGRIEFRGMAVVVRRKPIGHPLPDVAAHFIETIAIGGVGFDRSKTMKAILGGVTIGEIALPDVALPFSAGLHFRTPDISLLFKPSTCGVFPLRFGGQTFPGPFCISRSVLPADADDREIGFVRNGSSRPLRMLPVRPHLVFPPLKFRLARERLHRLGGAGEMVGSRLEQGWIRPGEIRRRRLTFRHRLVMRGINEGLELLVRDLGLIHVKGIERHLVNRPIVWSRLIIFTHQKGTCGNQDHARRR